MSATIPSAGLANLTEVEQTILLTLFTLGGEGWEWWQSLDDRGQEYFLTRTRRLKERLPALVPTLDFQAVLAASQLGLQAHWRRHRSNEVDTDVKDQQTYLVFCDRNEPHVKWKIERDRKAAQGFILFRHQGQRGRGLYYQRCVRNQAAQDVTDLVLKLIEWEQQAQASDEPLLFQVPVEIETVGGRKRHIKRETAFRSLHQICERLDAAIADPETLMVQPLKLYVYGSVLTDKEMPGDVDMVLVYEHNRPEEEVLSAFIHDLSYHDHSAYEDVACRQLRAGLRHISLTSAKQSLAQWENLNISEPGMPIRLIWRAGARWQTLLDELRDHPLPWTGPRPDNAGEIHAERLATMSEPEIEERARAFLAWVAEQERLSEVFLDRKL